MSTQPSGFVMLHFGPMSTTDMGTVSDILGEDTKMDTNVARLAGANFAFGPADALDALKARLVPAARLQAEAQHPTLDTDAITWLVEGQRGLSSEAMFSHLTGVAISKPNDRTAYPRDPDDLRRCRLLLDAVPALHNQIGTMASLSPIWAGLIAHWDELCALMDDETPQWRSGHGAAPRTYARMRAIFQGTA